MALSWSLEKADKVKVMEKRADGKFYVRERVEQIIWLTMVLGIGTITEETVDEFYRRLSFYESLLGPVFKDKPYTYREVRDCIGLTTNVYPKWTKTKFLSHMWEVYNRRLNEEIREEKRKPRLVKGKED